jgi:hypothetical protein
MHKVLEVGPLAVILPLSVRLEVKAVTLVVWVPLEAEAAAGEQPQSAGLGSCKLWPQELVAEVEPADLPMLLPESPTRMFQAILMGVPESPAVSPMTVVVEVGEGEVIP